MEGAEDSAKSLEEWLVRSCCVHPALAAKLATEWSTVCGITQVNELQQLQQIDPAWLDHMQCNIPTLPKYLINSNVERLGRVPLVSLTVEDVVMVVHKCYSSFQYDQSFQENLVTGFNLHYITDIHSLMKLGIPHRLHAETLMMSIEEWRRIGVPIDLLSLSEEEHMRRISGIKEERSKLGPNISHDSAVTGNSSSAINPYQSTSVARESPTEATPNDNEDVSVQSVPHVPIVGDVSNPVVLDVSSGGSVASCSGDSDDDWEPATKGNPFKVKDNERSRSPIEVDGAFKVHKSHSCINDSEEVEVAVSKQSNSLPVPLVEAVGRVSMAAATAKIAQTNGKSIMGSGKGKRAKALPTHALLSDEVLGLLSLSRQGNPNTVYTPEQLKLLETIQKQPETFPAISAELSGLSSFEHPMPSKGEEKAITPLDSSFRGTPRGGAWEYRTGFSPQGKECRVLTFIPGVERNGIESDNDDDEISKSEDAHINAPSIGNSDQGDQNSSSQTYVKTSKNRWANDAISLNEPMGGLFNSSDTASEQPNSGTDVGFDSTAAAEFNLVPEEKQTVCGPASSVAETFQSIQEASKPPRKILKGMKNMKQQQLNLSTAGDRSHDISLAQENDTTLSNTSNTTVFPVTSGGATMSSSSNSRISKNAEAELEVPIVRAKRGRPVSATTSKPTAKRTRGAVPTAAVSSSASVISSASAQGSTANSSSSKSSRGKTVSSSAASIVASLESAELSGQKLRQLDLLAANCHVILTEKDLNKLIKAVDYVGASASKREVLFLNEVLSSGVYTKMLKFIREDSKYTAKFLLHVLRALSLIVTRLERPTDFDVIFQKGNFSSVLRIACTGDPFVQLQALHLISELGIGQENDLKQRVLKSGAVPAIVQCYSRVSSSKNKKSLVEDVVAQCGNALYKLASTSTPEQLVYFREAIPTFAKLLSCYWTVVVDTSSALSFLIHKEHTDFIEDLKSGEIVDKVLHTLQNPESRDAVRWHCCMVIWAIARHCADNQLSYLFKATGIFCQLFQDIKGDPHLRAAALNTMQVLLRRSDVFVSQFVNFRDGSFLNSVISMIRDYEHNYLVLLGDSADSMMKYASFTLLNAIMGADKELMLRLLDASVYPLVFKIISINGEVDAPEEAKQRAVEALEHLLDGCEQEIAIYQQRAEKNKFDSAANWQLLRSLADGESLPQMGDYGKRQAKLHWKTQKKIDQLRQQHEGGQLWSQTLTKSARRVLYAAQALLLVPI